IKFFRFETDVKFDSVKDGGLVSRTGYTGEDGFEIYINKDSGRDIWNKIIEVGKPEGLEPVGLGARDTLRFEAGLPLYGQELTQDITPIEAGLKFAVKVQKDSDFIGKSVIAEQVENGAPRKIVGIEMIDKGIPRTGYEVFIGDEKVGEVTSDTKSPTHDKNIGNINIDADHAKVGTEVEIQVRKRKLKAVIAETPFYKR